jgi:3-hydroxyisobutyrate dehydrogenase-like beta-hydroxyacid dehydrogenase
MLILDSGGRDDGVGLIGLGLMGRGMGLRLLGAGFRLHALAHRRRDTLAALVAAGAVEAPAAAALAQATMAVVTCLPGIEALESVLFGPAGIVAGARPGYLVLDCSTLTPAAGRDFAQRLAARGIGFVGAPVTRGPEEAARGKLNAIAGGSPADMGRALPLLDAFCERVLTVGDAGAGYAAKLVNNFLAFGHYALIAEALAAVHGEGVAIESVLAAVSLGGGQSRVLDGMGPFLSGTGESRSRVTVATALKDLNYFRAMAAAAGAAGPVGAEVLARWQGVAALGAGDWSTAYFTRLANLPAPRPDTAVVPATPGAGSPGST